MVDAHPPREVVPAYRDVSAAVSDVERYRNDAEAFAAERTWSSLAEAQAVRESARTSAHQLESRADGDSRAFLARNAAHATQPDLTEFRLLWEALGDRLRRPAEVDPRPPGRRPAPPLDGRPVPARPKPAATPRPRKASPTTESS